MSAGRRIAFLAAALASAFTTVWSADHEFLKQLTSTDDTFGMAVCGLGDVNGDGMDDFAVAAPVASVNPSGGSPIYGAGVLKVYSGKDFSVLYTWKGGSNGAGSGLLGLVLDSAGDVNADGVPDLIAGERQNSLTYSDRGAAYVFSGKDGSTLWTFRGSATRDQLGYGVAGVGDVNGDGYDDVMAGAPRTTATGSSPGWACVYSGKDGTVLHTLTGSQGYAYFGCKVNGVGDVDADGVPDFAAAEVGFDATYGTDTNEGKVWVFSGKDGSVLHELTGPSTSAFGSSLAGVGDLDTDGHDDLLVGAPNWNAADGSEPGAAFLISGADGSTLASFTGEANGDLFGHGVKGGGDADGDGVLDFIVGAPSNDKTANGCGAAYVFSGRDGTQLFALYGPESYGSLGHAESMALSVDLNGDGRVDCLAGLYQVKKLRIYESVGPAGSIGIDGGASFVGSRSVTLSLAASDPRSTVTDVRLRNIGESWGGWAALSATMPWTLSSGEGEKTVEAEFRSADGRVSFPMAGTVVLDQTAPTGTLSIEGGAAYTGSRSVTLAFDWTDTLSEVASVRIRNPGTSFGPWQPATPTAPWTLPAGDGLKTVEAQGRDAGGNVSETVSDSISLDQTAPTGALVIGSGAPFTHTRSVQLSLSAEDTGAGVSKVRLRETNSVGPGNWTQWSVFSATRGFTLSQGEESKRVEMEVRDDVGNVGLASASVILDQTVPVVSAFTINDGEPCIAPEEPLVFRIVSTDKYGGAGVSGFMASFDGGATYGDWSALVAGTVDVGMPRPAGEGLLAVSVVVRDAAGNESAPAAAPLYLLERDAPPTGSAGKFTGEISTTLDVDAVAVELARGDWLSASVKGAAAEKGKSLVLALDLIAPDGTRQFTGRYPPSSTKSGVKAFPAPHSGRYYLVVRRESISTGEAGSYTLSVKVSMAKANRAGKGQIDGSEVTFEAAGGSVLKATVSAPGLTSAGITLTGPEGPVAFAATEGGGRVSIAAAVLDAGTGTYTLAISSPAALAYSWSVKGPPKSAGAITD